MMMEIYKKYSRWSTMNISISEGSIFSGTLLNRPNYFQGKDEVKGGHDSLTHIPAKMLLKNPTNGQINPPRMDTPVNCPNTINPMRIKGPYRSKN